MYLIGKNMVLKYRSYDNNEIVNSSKQSFKINSLNYFHMEFLEALTTCILSSGNRTIQLTRSDIIVSHHFKNIRISSKSRHDVIRLISIDIKYPSPLNQYLVADNPLIHDMMNDTNKDLCYICLKKIHSQICHNYLDILQIIASKKRDKYYDFQSQRISGLLLTELLHNHRQKISKVDSDFPSKKVKYASKDTQAGALMSYIASHHGQVTLSEMANEFGYQKNYLSRLCQKLFKQDFIHLRLNIRISLAKEQLKLTTKSIEEISNELGYKEVSSFSKQFSQITGISPQNWRKKSSSD